MAIACVYLCVYLAKGKIMNSITQAIEDRDTILGVLVSGDRWATAALERRDDLALIRRIVKAGIADALPLAIERAWMRGCGQQEIMRAASITLPELQSCVAAIYARDDA